MSSVVFEPKAPGESKRLSFDFLSQLAVGETISSAVVTSALYSGDDDDPEDMISGADSTSGSIVSQLVIGGVAGCIYTLTCVATTSLSQVLSMSGYLAVVNQAAV